MKIIKERQQRIIIRSISYQICVMLTLAFTGLFVGVSQTQILLMIVSGWTIGMACYYIHEAVWNQLQWQRFPVESKLRSVTKVITWRLVTICTVFFSAMLFEMTVIEGMSYTIIFNIAIIIVHYTHERIWNKIHWGRMQINKHNKEI